MKKRLSNRKRIQACSAHLVEVSNEGKDGEIVLTNKFKSHINRKLTQLIDVKSTKKELWRESVQWMRQAEETQMISNLCV